MRVFLGWLRGERGHCGMVAVPTIEEEDAKRPSRERESLVGERTRIVNRMKRALARLGIRGFKPELRKAPQRLEALRTPGGHADPAEHPRRIPARHGAAGHGPRADRGDRTERAWSAWSRHRETGPHAMVRLLASVIGVGIETADMLVQEVLSRNLRDRRAVARYAGLTGSPDESGSKRREKGLAKVGQCPGAPRPDPAGLALPDVPEGQRAGASGFVHGPRVPSGARKTTMIVALARKLLIALWRMVTTGEVPEGVVLRQTA